MKTKLVLSIGFCIPLCMALKFVMMMLLGLLFNSSFATYLNTPILFMLLGLSDIFIAFLIVYLFCVLNKEQVSSIISFDKNWGKNLLYGGLVGCLSVSLGILIIYLTKSISFESNPIRWLFIVTSFVMVALSAASEEILFRGLMQNKLMSLSKPSISVIITSIIFALLHIVNPDISFLYIVNVFLAGIVLGIIFLYSKNIFFPIGLHIFWNFVQDIADLSGDNLPSIFISNRLSANMINGGSGGFENSIVCTVILLLLIAFFYSKMTLSQQKKNTVSATV